MEIIFRNTEYSKTNEPHRFSLPSADKLNLKDPNKNVALANLSINQHGEILSLHFTTINLNSLLQLGMINLICLMKNILFQTFKNILCSLLNNMML